MKSLLLVLLASCSVAVRNVAITSSTAVGVSSSTFLTLNLATLEPSSVPLPPDMETLDNVCTDGFLVFALSTTTGRIASFSLSQNSLNFVSALSGIATGPYTGLSAVGGTLLVSGGTGGISVVTYTPSGELDLVAERVRLSGVIGHPDVVLLSSTLAVLQTDFTQGFGNLIANIDGNTINPASRFSLEGSFFS